MESLLTVVPCHAEGFSRIPVFHVLCPAGTGNSWKYLDISRNTENVGRPGRKLFIFNFKCIFRLHVAEGILRGTGIGAVQMLTGVFCR